MDLVDLQEDAAPPCAGARLYVLATDEAGTRAALKTVVCRAASSGRKVVILVPSIVPSGVALNGGAHDQPDVSAHYRRLAALAGMNADVRICRCRDATHIPSRLLLTHAEFVIGGHRGRWRCTSEEQLARQIERQGHRVTFADVDALRVRSGL